MRKTRRWALVGLCLFAASCASYLPFSLESRPYSLADGPVVEPIRVVHISDLHARVFSPLDEELGRRVRAFRPDLILITGDTVTSKKDYVPAGLVLDALGEDTLKLAIRGNWDASVDPDPSELRSLLEAHNGRLLVNETVTLNIKGRELSVYGIDDCLIGKPREPTLSDLPAETGFILCHEPGYVDSFSADVAARARTYVFAGHNHGGQVTLFGLPLVLPAMHGDYFAGAYRHGALRVFVSKGVGTSRYDFRFFARPDILLFQL
jgi:uncharacterized protein